MKGRKLTAFCGFLTICLLFSLAACGGGKEKPLPAGEDASVLVAYFSCTGNTEKVAGYIAKATGGVLYEIEAQTPYTTED